MPSRHALRSQSIRLVVAITLFATLAPAGAAARVRPRESARPAAAIAAAMPMAFEPNVGQSEDRVRYQARGRGYAVYVTDAEVVLALAGAPGAGGRDALRMRFVGAGAPRLAAERELPGKSNYLMGADERQWHRDVPTFEAVRLAGVYDGIDAVLYGTQRQLEYDFVVAPGADPSRIRVRFEGHESAVVDESGELVLRMRDGEVRQHRPTVFQRDAAGTRRVVARAVLTGDGEIGFDLGEYDRTKPLVVDPAIVYGHYLGGGGGDDYAYAVAVDQFSSVYVTGQTDSARFPVTPSPFDAVGVGIDAFVTKIVATGQVMVYSTYFGGAGADTGMGIAVDSAGHAYVTGMTQSSDVGFPTTPGAWDATYNGGSSDAFVAKLAPDGASVVFSTYLGAGGADSAADLAVDASGAVFVAGTTDSAAFPTTPGAHDTTFGGGGTDGFVTKLSPAGETLAYSTYLGGAGPDAGNGVAVAAGGEVAVAGVTGSADFATTQGAFDETFNGGATDAFAARLSAAGDALAFSTFLGGGGDDEAAAVAVDASGAAYVTGHTDSAAFPTTSATFDGTANGGDDAFVVKLSAAGSALVYSTYLGGADDDHGTDVGVDGSGTAFVVGSTGSSSFPTTFGSFDRTFNGESDAFVTRFASSGSVLAYSTYLGGEGVDAAHSVAVTSVNSTAVVAGETASPAFPTKPFSIDSDFNGGVDAFVLELFASGANLHFSIFLGSTGRDEVGDLAIDAAGAAYVVGSTMSLTFPTTPNALDPSPEGADDVFVTKISPDGATLLYSTFLGSEGSEYGSAVAVDAAGAVYVAGETSSATFPTTPGAYDSTHNGMTDAFVAKLAPAGNALVYSTFIGSDEVDYCSAIEVDGAGAAYMTGSTSSASFPTTAGAFDTSYNGGPPDAYVLKLAAAGDSLVYSTFLGASATEFALAIAVDASGAAFVAGGTHSSLFPTTPGAFDESFDGGSSDAFVTKLGPAGDTLVYSTALGTGGFDSVSGIDVDASGAAYVVGSTSSASFPTTPGAYDGTYNGGAEDAFVTKLGPAGDALVYSTFVGGSSSDRASGVAVDAWGAAYLTGSTFSFNFPTTPGAYYADDERWDAYLSKISPSGAALDFSTYLAGDAEDYGRAVEVDASGAAYALGWSGSDDFPETGFGYHDASSAFVMKLTTSRSGVDTPGIQFDGSGAWFLRNANAPGSADVVFGYGPPGLGWTALAGDWDGDGDDTPGLYDPSSGFFYLRNANSPGPASNFFGFGPGGLGWRPVVGDWDGDGDDTIGLYDPSSGFFFLRNTNGPGGASLVFGFGPGGLGWEPLAGDWDGDGDTTVGLYDPASGFYFIRQANAPGPADAVFGFGPGGLGWRPLVADWDGDGRDTVGLYDPASGFFYLRNQNASGPADAFFGYGPPGATPLVGDWDGR